MEGAPSARREKNTASVIVPTMQQINAVIQKAAMPIIRNPEYMYPAPEMAMFA
ncbi:hypothetical protein D3C72_2576140 [compost metagenome]